MKPGGAAGRILGALSLAAVLGACSGATAAGTTTSPAPKSAPLVSVDGGTATVDLDTVPTTLNDHTVAGDTPDTQAVCSLVWPQVFQVGPGDVPTLDTAVVLSAEVVSVNPQTVVYQINPKAEWSDGTPITAQDFVYAWVSQTGAGTDVDGRPDSVASVAGYDDIGSVTGSNDGRTVTVVFQTPYADWMSLFDDLLPAHVAEKTGWNSGLDSFNPSVLVSGGPWMVGSWTPGQSMALVRNPHWWGTPTHLDQLVLRAAPGGATGMAGDLRSGQAQVAAPQAFGSAFEAAVSSSSTLESGLQLGTESLQLEFNTRHAPLDSEIVRQGIAHDIDRTDMVIQLLQPVDPLVWEDNDHLFANSDPGYADDATGYEQVDTATAARDLNAGGLQSNAVGTWLWHGLPLTLTLVWASDDPWSNLAGPVVAAQLVAAGFDVVSDPASSAALFGRVLPDSDFDLALVPLQTGPYPSQMASAFGASVATSTDAVRDWSGFDDPKLDALFSQAAEQLAATPDEQLYRQIDTDLWSAMPTLPLFAEPEVAVWSASLTGVTDSPGPLGPLWSAGTWAQLQAASTRGSAARFPASSGRKSKSTALESPNGR